WSIGAGQSAAAKAREISCMHGSMPAPRCDQLPRNVAQPLRRVRRAAARVARLSMTRPCRRSVETSRKTAFRPLRDECGTIIHTQSSLWPLPPQEDSPMYPRRQFLQGSLSMAALAALGPLLPGMSFAADSLIRRAIPSCGEPLPVIGVGTSRTFNVDPDGAEMGDLLEVLRLLLAGDARLIDTAPSYGNAERVTGELKARANAEGKLF